MSRDEVILSFVEDIFNENDNYSEILEMTLEVYLLTLAIIGISQKEARALFLAAADAYKGPFPDESAEFIESCFCGQ